MASPIQMAHILLDNNMSDQKAIAASYQPELYTHSHQEISMKYRENIILYSSNMAYLSCDLK